jgi:hypothetical protein
MKCSLGESLGHQSGTSFAFFSAANTWKSKGAKGSMYLGGEGGYKRK